MNEKIKKIIPLVCAVVLVVVAVFWFLDSDLKHIEDTNGPDDFTLQTITDENIVSRDMGALNVGKKKGLLTGDTVTYHSDCFTGVYEVYGENIITNRYEITVNHARVDAGNFKMVLLVDDEIVHTFTLNELTQTFVLEDVRGFVSLRIAGESADFQFDYYVV